MVAGFNFHLILWLDFILAATATAVDFVVEVDFVVLNYWLITPTI